MQTLYAIDLETAETKYLKETIINNEEGDK